MTRLNQALVAATIGALGAASAMAGSKATETPSITVKVEELHPFTHLASLPDGSDLSSIKFEGVRIVRVATRKKSVTDPGSCALAAHGESGSERCPYTEFQARATAYEVTYSYRGRPLASDESGSNYFTFSVYLRQDEVDPALSKMLSGHKQVKAAAADFFALTSVRNTVQSPVIDVAASSFCEGNFVDGAWAQSDRKCGENVKTTTISAPSKYVTVKVSINPARLDSASNQPN